MNCKVCHNRPANPGGRCSRCATWFWRNGTERPYDVRTDRGMGKIKCAACGGPLAEHESPPCPMFGGRTA